MERFVDFEKIPSNITHVKIDVGLGMLNVQSQRWLKTDTDLFVFMFEPNPDSITSSLNDTNRIDDIIKKNNNAFSLIPVALSDVENESSMEFFSMERDGGTSSLLEPINLERLGPIKSKILVPVFSLKHFFDIFPWDRFEYIDYIKIDAQGSDLDIIKSAGIYLKDKVVFVTAEPETNDYSNCNHNTAENMETYLISQNFTRISHPNVEDPTFINNKFLHLRDTIYISQLSWY
jgi:FkbM family methyltransferase